MMARHFSICPPESQFVSLAQEKKDLRRQLMDRRNAFAADAGEKAGQALARRGLPIGKPTAQPVISGFHPYQSEISTLPLLSKLAGEGWVTALPVIVAKGQPLIFRSWTPGEPLASGLWDIKIPLENAEEVVPDVLIVPLLAFDPQGYRLGYGGGFYDRTLAKLRALKPITAIGVGFAAQAVAHVPHDELDQPVNYVMTDEATIPCG